MASGNFGACLDDVLLHEGGYTNDRRDPGNWTGGKVGVGHLKGTKKGIAAASFPHLDIKGLTDGEIADIYRDRYWLPLNGENLRIGDDLVIFDFGVNSGISRSAKYAQAIAGTEQDGIIGPITLDAISEIPSRDFIKAFCAKRLGFVQSLAIWNTFGKGWSRRIAGNEAKALSWVSTDEQIKADAEAARNVAAGQAAGAIGAGGAGTGLAIDQPPGVASLPIWAIAVVVLLIAAPLVIRSIINAQRAGALAHAAEEA